MVEVSAIKYELIGYRIQDWVSSKIISSFWSPAVPFNGRKTDKLNIKKIDDKMIKKIDKESNKKNKSS